MRSANSDSPSARPWLTRTLLTRTLLTRTLLTRTLLGVVALLTMGSGAKGLELAYSFEDGLQGFAANGLGISLSEDTIGATEGTQSMKVDIVQGATFVGALTDELLPFVSDPPGFDFLVFDLTLTEMFPEEAAFVDAGITVFGSTQPDFPGGPLDGLQVQFQNEQVQLQALPVGTSQVFMTLQSAVNPITFETGQSFNDIFGVEGSGQTDLIPTGFQLYINKSADAPWTGYIDNVRVGSIADPNGGDYNGDGVVDAADYTVWRDNLGSGPDGDGTTTGDLLGVPDGVVDESDYDYWAQQYGTTISPPASAIPEPVSGVLAILTVLAAASARRRAA